MSDTTTYLGKLGELTLKGSNIRFFEHQLLKNLTHSLPQSLGVTSRLLSGRLYVTCPEQSCPPIEFALDHLVGITGWAKVAVCDKTIEAIKEAAHLEGMRAKQGGARTFKVEARREDKSFPLTSYQIACQVGSCLFDDGTLSVDVHHPDVTIHVEVRDKCYVFCHQSKGRRGLPVGTGGKGLLLLSGGIDSPVAGYKMICRGMSVDALYFHSHPYTSAEAQAKVQQLARILSLYGTSLTLHVVSLTDVQTVIKQKTPEPYSTMILRTCMMQAANRLARDEGGFDCLITGESLGQVASQTAQNLAVTESFSDLPVYRPLIGCDKEEIVAVAKSIGTYETSILPYEDCCVLFSPRHPVLRASIAQTKAFYDALEADELLGSALKERQIFRYSLKDTILKDTILKDTIEEQCRLHEN